MKKLFVTFASLALVCSLSGSAHAWACIQRNNTIGMMGLHPDGSDQKLYASVSGHNNGCGCNYFWFKEANTNTKMALSLLTAAKLAGKKVRIDLKTSGDCGSAYHVLLQ